MTTKGRRHDVSKLAVVVFLAASTPVYPQTEAVSAAVTLDRIDNALSAAIENAASEANIVVFNAATEARLLLQQWRRENAALLDQATKGGNSVVANALNSMSAMANRLEVGGQDARRAAEGILDGAQQLTQTLTLDGDTPIFRRLSPTYVVPGVKGPLEIAVAGVNLHNISAAELRIAGRTFKPTNPTQTAMQFIADDSIRNASTTTSGELLAELVWKYPHTSWWRRTVGQKIAVSYPLRMLRLPIELGHVTLSYAEANTVRQSQERSQQFYHRRGGKYRSQTCDSVPIRPYDGYKIDVTSIRRTYDTGAYGSFELLNPTPEGFIGKSCASSGSRSGYKDTILVWNEVRDVEVVGERADRQTLVLNWTEDLPVRIPSIARAPELTIRVFDGRTFVVSGPGIHDFGFVRATYDTNASNIIVHPIPRQYRIE